MSNRAGLKFNQLFHPQHLTMTNVSTQEVSTAMFNIGTRQNPKGQRYKRLRTLVAKRIARRQGKDAAVPSLIEANSLRDIYADIW